MNIADYLLRIGIILKVRPDYETLRLLQNSHMFTVPLENMNIKQSRRISLQLDDIYRKVVTKNRGGYCYELNGLFQWLLVSLGYDSAILSGRVPTEENDFRPEFDHMLLKEKLNEEYIADMGFGDSSRNPVPLSGEFVEDISGRYRALRINGKEMCPQRDTEGSWITQYKFTTAPRRMENFEEMNTYQQTSPKSHFTRSLICSMATASGRVTLSGNRLVITDGAIRREKTVETGGELYSILAEYFGMSNFD